jgi:hypothetical protein
MDVENVENLLDYVYTPEDFAEKPSMLEYKKLKRVMKVMVNFYKKGTENKRLQVNNGSIKSYSYRFPARKHNRGNGQIGNRFKDESGTV